MPAASGAAARARSAPCAKADCSFIPLFVRTRASQTVVLTFAVGRSGVLGGLI